MTGRMLLILAVAASCGCGGSSDPATEDDAVPEVTAVGAPLGMPVTADVGATGGTVTSADGKLVLRIPAGALATTTTITIQRITAEAPGGLFAWRLGPEGTTFAVPIELVMTYGADDVIGSSAEALEIGFQNADRTWSVLNQITHDPVAQTLVATTTHFSDWSSLQGLQLRPGAPIVQVGKSIELVVNNCRPVDMNETVSLLSACVPTKLATTDWSVNGMVGGNAALGKIDSKATGTATFAAPMQRPMPSARVAVSTSFTSRRGAKSLLVAQVAIVDTVGWSGAVKYVGSGSKKTNTVTLAGTTRTQIDILHVVSGSGAMYFEPSFIPEAMLVDLQFGDWSESREEVDVATDTQPVCPQVNTSTFTQRYHGFALPVEPATGFVFLSISGNTYQLGLSTLPGFATGPHRIASSGHLVPGGTGTNCMPAATSDTTFEDSLDFPQQPFTIEGTIDPKKPNEISGQATFTYVPTLEVDATQRFDVTWRFSRPVD